MKKTSRLQIAAQIGALLPLAFLIWDNLTGNLTVNPIQTAMQRTGQAAIVLLVLTLACTPVNVLFRYPPVVSLRKILGLYAFMYAFLHLFIYVALDYGFGWGYIFQSFVEKPYLWAGVPALIILLALAFTSFRFWQKNLGKNWKRLHRLVYLAGFLAAAHFFLVIKGDLWVFKGDILRPLLVSIILVVLLALRLPFIRRRVSGVFARAKNPEDRKGRDER